MSLGNLIFTPIGPRHALPLYAAALSLLVMAAALVQMWRKAVLKPAGRIYTTLFVAAQVLLIGCFAYWGFFFV